jgi:hypothetical protein
MNQGTALTLGFGVILVGALLLTSGVRNRALGEVLKGETGAKESGGTPGVTESQTGGGVSAPPPSSIGGTATTSSTVGKLALAFFGKKYGKVAAAGIVGNLQQESSLNPADKGGYLAQWGGARLAGLKAFAQKFNAPVTSASTQLAYIDYELRTSERATLKALLKSKTPAEAARVFSEKYERPGIPDLANREAYANQWAR